MGSACAAALDKYCVHVLSKERSVDEIAKVLDGLGTAEKIIVIPNGRDLTIFQPGCGGAEVRRELAGHPKTPDARAMQLVRGGVPVGAISIPCRYVHTASEMVDLRDVENAVKLITVLLRAPARLK